MGVLYLVRAHSRAVVCSVVILGRVMSNKHDFETWKENIVLLVIFVLPVLVLAIGTLVAIYNMIVAN